MSPLFHVLLLLLCALCVAAASKLPHNVQGASVIELNDANFEEILADEEAVVNFYAPWCHNCVTFKPVFYSFSSLLIHEFNVIPVMFDCTLNPQIAAKFNVRAYPSLMFIRDNVVVDQYNGARTENAMLEWVRQLSRKRKRKTGPPPSPHLKQPSQAQAQEKDKDKDRDAAQQQQPTAATAAQNKKNVDLFDFNIDINQLPTVQHLILELLNSPTSLMLHHPWLTLMIVYIIGVFNGLFFGVLIALREKRNHA